jgi:hypothetical protein
MSGALVGYLLIAILFSTAFAAIAWMARFRDPQELWTASIRRITAVIVTAAATTVGFAIFYDEAREIGPVVLLVLQVAKDAPGLVLVSTYAGLVACTSVAIANRASYWERLLEACPRVFAAGLLLAIVVGLFGHQQAQLEDGPGQWAVLYRGFLYGPVTLYSVILALALGMDARILGGLDAGLKRRYYLFATGVSTWALLSADHIARPTVLALLGSSPVGLTARLFDLIVAGLWIAMAACMVYGYASKARARTGADHALAATNTYRMRSTDLIARLDDPKARWRELLGRWQRRKSEVAETVRERCTDNNKGGDEADRQARVAKTGLAIMAMLAYEPQSRGYQTRTQLADYRLAYEANAGRMNVDSPIRRVLLEDRIALATPSVLWLMDDSEDFDHSQISEEWVQVVALVGAELNLLPSHKTQAILSPDSRTLDPDVHQALKDVRFLFRDRPLSL